MHSLTGHIPNFFAKENLRNRNAEAAESMWRIFKNVARHSNHHLVDLIPQLILTEERLARKWFDEVLLHHLTKFQ
jgi:hypothetical protein